MKTIKALGRTCSWMMLVERWNRRGAYSCSCQWDTDLQSESNQWRLESRLSKSI